MMTLEYFRKISGHKTCWEKYVFFAFFRLEFIWAYCALSVCKTTDRTGYLGAKGVRSGKSKWIYLLPGMSWLGPVQLLVDFSAVLITIFVFYWVCSAHLALP